MGLINLLNFSSVSKHGVVYCSHTVGARFAVVASRPKYKKALLTTA